MKILILINDVNGLYKFRKELVIELVKSGHEVIVAAPDGEYKKDIIALGASYYDVQINRRGTKLKQEVKLLKDYIRIIKQIHPNKVITYTIKPNLYGGLACRICKVKYITAVVGLGSVYIGNQAIKPIIMALTRIALRKSETVFFLNKDNEEFYQENNLILPNQKVVLVRGSGVDTNVFQYSEQENKPDCFLFVGRLFRDKGIYEYIKAARVVKRDYPEVSFNILGFCEDRETRQIVLDAEKEKIVSYFGRQRDVIPFMKEATCIVLPSYGEGCGTVLQEGASIGRPLITCDTYGCRDNVIEDYNGYFCRVADSLSLIEAMKRMINTSYEKKREMGLNSRKMAEEYFERGRIIEVYLREVQK